MKFPPKIEAYLLDDFLNHLENLENTLKESGLFQHIYSFTEEEEMMAKLKEQSAKYTPWLFADFYLNGISSFPLFKDILQINSKAKIVVITAITNPFVLKEQDVHSLSGLLHKSDRNYDILECIKSITNEQQFCSLFMKEQLASAVIKKKLFTKREIQLLNLWGTSYTIEATAELLNLSPHTVVSHRRRMFKKVDCHTVEELIEYARSKKLIKQ